MLSSYLVRRCKNCGSIHGKSFGGGDLIIKVVFTGKGSDWSRFLRTMRKWLTHNSCGTHYWENDSKAYGAARVESNDLLKVKEAI
ncbi:hypothetical protein [Desulforamulus aquiferis]|uniref:Uncharacterized protein n=1 Tax=Desulforamulus aquiferis TaxID=1397668 RepID=A0AAW7ZJ84_9FIRM|nr:hypothetical protein [Desulforamulus aquiferis]MDO7788811.1 hypothetical protein [Desulforamulus aquiferis]